MSVTEVGKISTYLWQTIHKNYTVYSCWY